MDEKTEAKKKRKYLNEFARAKQDIELAGAAITLLENVSDAGSVIKTLERDQQKYLRRMDAAAAKLGAPLRGITTGSE